MNNRWESGAKKGELELLWFGIFMESKMEAAAVGGGGERDRRGGGGAKSGLASYGVDLRMLAGGLAMSGSENVEVSETSTTAEEKEVFRNDALGGEEEGQ